MLKNIIIAAENFCVHQIREEHSLSDSLPKTKTLIAYIDIEANDSKKYRVYIATEHGFAQRVSKIYLEEDESDEETLIDMVLELANLIIGSAKVLAESEGKNPFSIALQLPENNSFPTSMEFLFSAFQEKGNKARFVISIEDGDKKLFYKEYFLIEQLNENKKWSQFKKSVSLPLINNKNAVIKFYVWNPDTSNVYIDDLIIRFPIKECPYQVFENLE